MDYFTAIDIQLLSALRLLKLPSVADQLFNWLMEPVIYVGAWCFLTLVVFFRHAPNRWYLPSVMVSGLLAFFWSEVILKPLIARPRPETYNLIQSLANPSYSFPSTHTTFAFALAAVLSMMSPNKQVVWYSLAAVVGLLRVMLGYHYPFDVVGSAILGLVVGYQVVLVTKNLTGVVHDHGKSHRKSAGRGR